jgi:hypothetical protein
VSPLDEKLLLTLLNPYVVAEKTLGIVRSPLDGLVPVS